MRLFVVSDLHVTGAGDPVYRSLLRLLQERAESGDTVVLAGDVFDLFVGAKRIFLERYFEFLDALKGAAERGVQLHYIEGNHDFLIRKAFRGIPMAIHSNGLSLELAGRRFLIVHGDLVDKGDLGYRFLRAFFRSPIMRAFVFIAPGKWIDAIGRGSSRYSGERRPRLPGELPIERRERLRRIYRSYAAEELSRGYDFVLAGHVHDLDEMVFTLGPRKGQYMNVGFPRVHGSMLSWTPEDETVQREAFS